MSKKKKSILPSIEIIIVLVFFLSFIVWAVSKCNATKIMYQEQAVEETAEEDELNAGLDETTLDGATTGDPLNPTAATSTVATATPNTSSTTISNTNPTVATTPPSNRVTSSSTSGSILYVTIDGLNMRTGPHLDSSIIRKLELFEEVVFMNEVTDTTQQISLGKEIANEPWVKIRQKRGHVGWVYGAGVHYYKKKREGVE